MTTTVLSDHGGDRLRKREAERGQRYDLQLREFTNRVKMREARIDALKASRALAWTEKRYLHALGRTLVIVLECYRKHSDEKRRPVKAGAGVEDSILENGRQGEMRVEEYLARQLDDRWTLLCGYKNGKGEIDRIVIGPDGVFALEIKNYRGVISCRGDEWKRDKYDRWGNLVRHDEPIVDKGGRGPSRQVNEPADLLETFLVRTVPGCKICRCVVFSACDAELADISGITVDGVYLLRCFDVQDMLCKSAFKPDAPEAVEKLARQIERDHHFWEGRSKKRILDPNPGRDPELSPAA
jgi:hypothetical protein